MFHIRTVYLLMMILIAGCDKRPDDRIVQRSSSIGNLYNTNVCGPPLELICELPEVINPNIPACPTGTAIEDSCELGAKCVFRQAHACSNGDIDTQEIVLTCLSEPPPKPWTCPISGAEAKKNIQYLDASNRQQVANEILKLRLANYEYEKGYPDAGTRSLGFIIDDSPNATFLTKSKKRVNLYSYVSALVATVQEQNTTIHQLQKDIRELKKLSQRKNP